MLTYGRTAMLRARWSWTPQTRNGPRLYMNRDYWWGKVSAEQIKENEEAVEDKDDAVLPEVEESPQDDQSTTSALKRIGSGDEVPKISHVLALPVARKPVFPGFLHPVTLQDSATIDKIIELKTKGTPYVGVFMESEEGAALDGDGMMKNALGDVSQIKSIGALAQVQQIGTPGTPGGLTQIVLLSHRRISIVDGSSGGNPLHVKVDYLENGDYDPQTDVVKAYANEVIATLRDIIKLNPMLREQLHSYMQKFNVQDPAKLADFAAALTNAGAEDLQDLFETLDIPLRLEKVLQLLKKEHALVKLQQQISQQVEEKVSANQREYLLREQMKKIKEELGIEKDDKDTMVQKYKDAMERPELVVPEEAAKVIDGEISKLGTLEKNSSEFNVTRTYLDWLTSLPWGIHSPEVYDVKLARGILDEDHYGMQDVKDRVLEFIAVSKLCGETQGKIMCMVGPPGVGKTSIGKSIARALDRQFFRFSVGGLSDVSEIKGHRRTYVGAMPGKLIQCLKTCGTSNPLILIDEIDKLGRGFQGDPASALLELLDMNQNMGFMDHYLDVPVDLSKALFVCTANVEDTIPGPLLDRMELIRLAGYDLPEKKKIALNYLEPKVRKMCGLESSRDDVPKSLGLKDSAIDSLIRWYCREAGVRNLEKHLERIYRKVALKMVQAREDAEDADATVDGEGEGARGIVSAERQSGAEEDDGWSITAAALPDYVGKPLFTSDRLFEVGVKEGESGTEEPVPLGVATGLAWTSMGGATLYIETIAAPKAAVAGTADGSTASPSRGSLHSTGQLGDVMGESSRIAHTYARVKLHEIDPKNDFLETAEVHLHVPEGATPKDGPSAGVTMVTAMLSLALAKRVPADLAMTGEVTLTGMVLKVGGIKEKVIAARRSLITTLVLPNGNQRDFDELPDYLKEGLTVHYARRYKDVYNAVFGDH